MKKENTKKKKKRKGGDLDEDRGGVDGTGNGREKTVEAF